MHAFAGRADDARAVAAQSASLLDVLRAVGEHSRNVATDILDEERGLSPLTAELAHAEPPAALLCGGTAPGSSDLLLCAPCRLFRHTLLKAHLSVTRTALCIRVHTDMAFGDAVHGVSHAAAPAAPHEHDARIDIPLERIVDVWTLGAALDPLRLLGVRFLVFHGCPRVHMDVEDVSWEDVFLADIADHDKLRHVLQDAVAERYARVAADAPCDDVRASDTCTPARLGTLLAAFPFTPWGWAPALSTEQMCALVLRTCATAVVCDRGPGPDGVWGVPAPHALHDAGAAGESDEDSDTALLDAPDPAEHAEHPFAQWAQHEFAASFGLPADEHVAGHVKATLARTLPVPGRVFVTPQHVAFRSSNLFSRVLGQTRLVIALDDVVGIDTQATQHARYGLVLVVRGTEDVFLEFGSHSRRQHCAALLQYELDAAEQRVRAEPASDVPRRVAPRAVQPVHITMLTIGSRGDVQPYVALAQRLLACGHRVRLATHAEFRDWAAAHGVDDFCEIGGDPAELIRICVENGTFTLAFLREGVTKFRTWLGELLGSSWAACQGTDVVVESPSTMAGSHIAEALGLPYFRAFTMPWTPTRAYPHAFAVPSGRAGGQYNAMTYMVFEQLMWRASARAINRWRRHTLQLPPTTLERRAHAEVPFLYNFSAHVVPKPLDWSAHTHITGYWYLDAAHGPAALVPPGLPGFLAESRARGRKIVYIGWGSIVVPDAPAVTRAVYGAVAASGVCAVLCKGWSSRNGRAGALDADPETRDVFCVDAVSHDWLFPQLDAVCHHGGAGTVGASVRAGVPLVVRPFFGDQFFWARQIEALGIGTALPALSAEALAHALTRVTTDVRIRTRAARMGARVRAEDGVGTAVDVLFREMPRARAWTEQRRSRRGGAAAKPRDGDDEDVGDGSAELLDESWFLVETLGRA
ncbi:sterol 3beta-glucosyltransferase [Malassezia sp. CBS 17886]|nr:sterol 3beta-glucosyltransferase [Malassezia sp. CBS 17886]